MIAADFGPCNWSGETSGSQIFTSNPTRTRYGVQLTEAASMTHPELLRALDQVENSLLALEAINARQHVIVSTVPSSAASWLVPRLGKFSSHHPAIEVRVEATSDLVDLRRERVDVAIRHGLGVYPGLEAKRLMAPVLVPVASPKLLAEGPPIRKPADCLAYPLLQDSDRADWPLWLKALGVADDPRAERGSAFEDDFLLIRAAESGQGLALIRDNYANDEIAAGRLALAHDQPWPAQFAYYMVTSPHATRRAAVEAFVDWLQSEAIA